MSSSTVAIISQITSFEETTGPNKGNDQAGRSAIIAIIAGATAGGVALLAAAVLGYLAWLRRQRKAGTEKAKVIDDLQNFRVFQTPLQQNAELNSILSHTLLSNLGRTYTAKMSVNTFTFSSGGDSNNG